MPKKLKITFSYDGSKFYGSQIQKQKVTVLGEIQRAFEILKVEQNIKVSGRTDRGVHALNQVCHLHIPEYLNDLDKLKQNLNHMIKPYIYIKKLEFADDKFHARFSAKKRLYRYIISHNDFNPFCSDLSLFTPFLDADSINKNSQEFKGVHNFKYFKKNGSNTKTDIREIYKCGAYSFKNHTILYFLGNSFLRSQVRMMCDYLIKIEQKKLTLTNLKEQLNLTKVTSTSIVPPNGLYLSKIYY
jgi:tRNA pseudouridine38-40 synthase